jgi:hypothetical protein
MSRGIRNVWIRGERTTSTARNTKGQDQLMLGITAAYLAVE